MDNIKRGSKRNFFMVDNGVFDERLNLEALDMLVYICLLRYADNNSKECFPAMQTIADDIGIGRNRVNKAIKILEQKKLIEKKQRFDKTGSKKSNLYIVYDANEVINTMYPQNTGYVSPGDMVCIPGRHDHVSSGYMNYTHLNILSKKEKASCSHQENQVNLKTLKGIVTGALHDLEEGDKK